MINFRSIIEAERKIQKMTKRTLCRLSGVPYSTLNTYLSGKDTGSETVAKLLDVLGISEYIGKSE